MATVLAAAARPMYVPSNRRLAATAERPQLLAYPLAIRKARDAFRHVAWTGVAPVPVQVAASAHAAPDPRLTTRLAFASVAWNGATVVVAPTTIQEARSVAAVLGNFNWGVDE